jgi:hypothetical protein
MPSVGSTGKQRYVISTRRTAGCRISEQWKHTTVRWGILSHYQRFESLVAFILTIIISLIILVALYQLTTSVVWGLIFDVLDPLDHKVFQMILARY